MLLFFRKEDLPQPLMLGGGGLALALVLAGGWFFLAPGGKPPAPAPAPQPHDIVAPPASQPAPPPAPATPPPPSPQAVTAAIAAKLPSLACSFVQAKTEGNGITLQGIAGTGTPIEAIQRLAQSASVPTAVNLEDFAGPYCPPLDVLAPILRKTRLDLIANETAGPVKADQAFRPTLKSLPFAAWLQVDYISSDGKVFHVLPTAANASLHTRNDPARLLPMGTTLNLGKDPHTELIAGPPFGTDMFVAIASSEKLFSTLRPQLESIAQYTAALKAATDRVDRNGGRLAAGVALVATIDK